MRITQVIDTIGKDVSNVPVNIHLRVITIVISYDKQVLPRDKDTQA